MIFKKKIDMAQIIPTSKMSLKNSCIRACGNDLKAASELYDFYIKDIPNLPDFDVAPPSPVKQAMDIIGKAFEWFDNNQDRIAGYYNMFQQIRSGHPIMPPMQDVPGVPPPPTE